MVHAERRVEHEMNVPLTLVGYVPESLSLSAPLPATLGGCMGIIHEGAGDVAWPCVCMYVSMYVCTCMAGWLAASRGGAQRWRRARARVQAGRGRRSREAGCLWGMRGREREWERRSAARSEVEVEAEELRAAETGVDRGFWYIPASEVA